jgi:hypothetical protein
MADTVTTNESASVTSLVTGIVNDAQELLKQNLELFKAEVRSDLRRTTQVALSFAAGAGVAVLAVILLSLMVVYGLHAATDESLPLWACYGIVGGVFLLGAGVLLYLGKKKLDSFNPLPDKTVEAMKENVQWLTNPSKTT